MGRGTERLGVSMKSREAVLRTLESGNAQRDQSLALIKDYILRTDIRNTVNFPPDFAFRSLAIDEFVDSVCDALKGEEAWLQRLALNVRLDHIGLRLCYYWHHRFRILFPNHPQPLKVFNWEAASEAAASSLILGWRDEAVGMAALGFAALNRGYQVNVSYEQWHRRAQAFILRLIGDFDGSLAHQWPENLTDEPIYEELLQRWREPDPQVLVPLLVEACERHVRESKHDTSTKFFDFYYESHYLFPFEILALLRLREFIGLDNTRIDHPLMTSPFDRPPLLQPLLGDTDGMKGTLSRVRADWPDFEAVTFIPALRAFAAGGGR